MGAIPKPPRQPMPGQFDNDRTVQGNELAHARSAPRKPIRVGVPRPAKAVFQPSFAGGGWKASVRVGVFERLHAWGETPDRAFENLYKLVDERKDILRRERRHEKRTMYV